jgi:hypothetical protein
MAGGGGITVNVNIASGLWFPVKTSCGRSPVTSADGARWRNQSFRVRTLNGKRRITFNAVNADFTKDVASLEILPVRDKSRLKFQI